MNVTATVTSVDDVNGTEMVKTSTGHHLQYGGPAGDGYCYGHQSFDCLARLTREERDAINAAPYPAAE